MEFIYRGIECKTMNKNQQLIIMTKKETIRFIGTDLCYQLFQDNGYFQYGKDVRTFYLRCNNIDLKLKINKALNRVANERLE